MLWLVFTLALAPSPPPQVSSAEMLMTQAVAVRLGDRVTVAVHVVDSLPAGSFVSAAPDPMGRLGGEMNFTLIPAGPGARAIRVRARVDVVGGHVRARRQILRGHIVTAEDVEMIDGPVTGVPVKRLPELSQIVGQHALRPVEAGQVVESSSVAVRHLVQAGDTVTVVAVQGAVRVTAQFVAADSGDPGDIVRVVNKDTHRSIRVRVVNKGIVEVIDAR